MKPDVLSRKLDTLARHIQRIEEVLPKDAETLIAEQYTQDVIALNLERSVQMCVDAASHILSDTSEALPETMAGLFPQPARAGIIDQSLADVMTKAAGLRNLAVHEYTDLDWKELHGYLPQALSDLRSFAGQIQAHVHGTHA